MSSWSSILGHCVVEDQQACANMAVENEEAKFWTFHTNNYNDRPGDDGTLRSV